MKVPTWENDPSGQQRQAWLQMHREWHNASDIAEMVGEEQLTGFQKLNIGNTEVYRLTFGNGSSLRIHGYQDTKNPLMIKLFVEHYADSRN